MLRSVVVDDEKLSREVLCNYLKEYCTDVDVVAKAFSVKTAYRTIRKFMPDLVFLDIEMADGKGFDLLTMFDKINFRIIFVTAYSEYAVKAFRFSAVDYLLKPIKIDELRDAVERVRSMNNNLPGQGNITALVNNMRPGAGVMPTLVIPHLKGFEVLRIQDIIMCQAEGYCTNFYVSDNRKVVSSKNLKHFDILLEDHSFARVHHSYVVNLNHVKSFTRQGEIILTGGLRASLGDSYKNDFNRLLGRK